MANAGGGPEGTPGPPEEWPGSLAAASVSLGTGSALLFSGALLTVATPNAWFPAWLIFLGWFGMLFHIFGWVLLGLGMGEAERELGTTLGMSWALGGSVVAFILGVGALPLAYPAWPRVFGLSVMPYTPSVWAPVVFGHVIMFLLGGRTVPDRRAVTRVFIGTAGLAAVAAAGVGAQLAMSPATQGAWPLVWLLAGLTAPGYLVAASGWRRAWRPSHGPDGPEKRAVPEP